MIRFYSITCATAPPLEKVESNPWGSESSSKHRCILFLLSLFHSVVLLLPARSSLLPRGLHLLLFSSSLFAFSFSSSFASLPLLPPLPSCPRPPSSSAGVNLSPRLSPNPELYKLKPISLPGLRSSYSGHFIFVYLLSANMLGLPRSGEQPATTNGQRPTAFCSHTLHHHHVRTYIRASLSHARSLTLARFRASCVRLQASGRVLVDVWNFVHAQPAHVGPRLYYARQFAVADL